MARLQLLVGVVCVGEVGCASLLTGRVRMCRVCVACDHSPGGLARKCRKIKTESLSILESCAIDKIRHTVSK